MQNIANSISKDFCHFAKNISSNLTSSCFSPFLSPCGTTAVTSIGKDELFAETFTANSILDDSKHTPTQSPHPSLIYTFFIILDNTFYYNLSYITHYKA